MKYRFLAMLMVLAVVLVGMASASPAEAGIEELRARLEQRRAEREAERAERRAEREARRAERERENEQEEIADETSCRCSARLGLSRPSLTFRGGSLVFEPRVDVRIRSRGDQNQKWTAKVKYEAETNYQSDEITAPAGVSTSGEQEVFSGDCGSSFSFKGIQLPSMNLTGVVSNLLGEDEELMGYVKMKAQVSGCGFDEEYKMFKFELEEFNDLRVGGWRGVR